MSDRERSAAFYAEQFGLTQGVQQWEGSGTVRVRVPDPDSYCVAFYAF